MNINRLYTACGLAVLAAVGGFLSLRQGSQNNPVRLLTEQNAPQVVFSEEDSSSSDRRDLPAAVRGDTSLALDLDPAITFVTIHRFDSDSREIFSGGLPSSDEEFASILLPRLIPVSGRDNTYVQKAVLPLVERIKGCSGKVIVVMHTDYFCEGMTPKDHEAIRKSLTSISKNPHFLGLFMCGVAPENMESMRQDFGTLGSKLIPVTGSFHASDVSDLFAAGGVK